MATPLPFETLHRLLRHEAQVHALPGRELRDLGDALLLLDHHDPEPFWNRLEAVRWPDDSMAFDRRLAEVAVVFASLGRQPHIWVSPSQDSPVDLAQRLLANGFEDTGPGYLMVSRDPSRARAAIDQGPPAGVVVERLSATIGAPAQPSADQIVDVLLGAFGGMADRASVVRETMTTLGDPRFTHYLTRFEGRPVAVARRATFDRMSYLSSIGTIAEMRGRGLGRFVTAVAQLDGFDAGSDWVHLGVFADNLGAQRLYRGLGFVEAGIAGPDMILVR